MSEKVVWQLLQPYAMTAGVPGIAPHDLRRSCAKMCRAAGGETHCWMDGRTVMGAHRWRGVEPVEGLYVHPKTGILRRAPERKWGRAPKPVTRVRLSDLAHYQLIEGVWFRFGYRKRDADEVLKVVRFHEDQPERNLKYGLRQPGDRRIVRYR